MMNRLIQSNSSTDSPLLPSTDAEDKELVERVKKGDERAFETLFLRYSSKLTQYLTFIVGDNDIGCDLAQEAFITAWNKLPNLENNADFKTWLYRIGVNKTRDHFRHVKLIRWIIWPTTNEEEDLLPGLSTEQGFEQRVEEAEIIKMAWNNVSPKYRSCLYLDIFEDMTQHGIAILLDMSERSVRRYIQLGKEQLRASYINAVNEAKHQHK